jgi:hypothetical protein
MKNKKIIFRPTSEITEKVTPSPIASKNNIPKWYKNLKRYYKDETTKNVKNDFFNDKTAKTCIPMFDSITSGYLYTLPYDLLCLYDKDGNRYVNWGDKDTNYIGTHSIEQIGEYPIPDGYENIILKINTTWCVQTPPGYSLLYMHPLGRFDLPFYSFHGIVDSDIFYKNINMPIVLKRGFEGVIKQGTPISQLIPIKRDRWKSEQKKFNQDGYNPFIDNLMATITMEKWYMNKKWIKKQYE